MAKVEDKPEAKRKPARGSSRSRHHDGDREPARRHRARDDQHAAARRALRGHLERARLLLLHPHRRQPPARFGGGPAGAHLRRPPPGREHVQVPRWRHPRGRRLSRQRPLWRQHAPRRPHLPGAGVHRGRAPVHDGRQVPHGRHRQLDPVELFRQGARRLRGRRARVSGRAHPAQLQERAGHHPHVPRAHPRARAMVRRRARRARLARASPSGGSRSCARSTDKKTIKTFIKDWFDYSERRMVESIRKLPKARIENTGRSDPLEGILPTASPSRSSSTSTRRRR